MSFRAAATVSLALFFLATHAAAQSCSSTQYLMTKPKCESINAKCCTDGSTNAGTTGTMSNGESPYPPNSLCKWTIGPFSSISVRFTRFDTESTYDRVQLRACLDETCKQFRFMEEFFGLPGKTDYESPTLNTDYTTTGGYLQLVFSSDGSIQKPGFAATWSVSGGYPVCTECPSNSLVNQTSVTRDLSTCACNAGYVGPGGGPCTACDYGKYKASPILCANCPFRSNSMLASSSCECSPGSEGNPFVACTDCPPGKYKYDLGGACAACPDGTFSSFPGSIECNECPKGTGPSTDRTRCESCPDGTQISATFSGQCNDCPIGFYSNIDTNKRCVPCPSGFYSTALRTAACTPCRACPDGFFRADCTATAGGGVCKPCLACPPDRVNVGCMNRAGNSNQPGVCRNRTYVSRTPLCDQEDSGLGLGGYTFLGLFGVSQDDASFQCRRRCDNQQNVLSREVYKDNATFTELLGLFPNANGKPRAFDGGQCGGPYACDVANCNIPGSSDDSQTDYQPKLACPVHIEPATAAAFWAAVDAGAAASANAIAAVDDMRAATCQTCATCGSAPLAIQDWGRGCARDCTQLACEPGFIFDWTEPDPAAKCKPCGELDDIRVCLSSEQRAFAGYDVSGWLPKVYLRDCRPKRQLPLRNYESAYGSCVKCEDFVETCAASDTYYHTCEAGATSSVPIAACRPCARLGGRDPARGRFWDGYAFRALYCQQPPCSASAGVEYTGISTEAAPDRVCHAACAPDKMCSSAQVGLPCVLPHQSRCVDAINMDTEILDPELRAVRHAPAHANLLEPNTTEPHLFASFENVLVDTDASTLALRAVCVWNADFIPDNAANPAGVSSRFQSACRAWLRDPRAQYPLLPLQNTVASETTDVSVFPRRVLLNTSATAVAYSRGPVPRPDGVFSGDVYLELDLSNTNNATLAAFIPHDRGVEVALWVPRWRASVHARQLAGDSVTISLASGPEQTCFGCFALVFFPETTSTWTTASSVAALAGDKFVFQPAPGLLVCEKAVQARAYPAWLSTRYDASLAVLFASLLSDACVTRFGLRAQDLGIPADLVRSTPVLSSGPCVLYAYSATRVYCVRRTGGFELAWNSSSETLLDLAAHDGSLVRTFHSGLFGSGDTANYFSLMSTPTSTSTTSFSDSVLPVSGLLMLARGAPQYFLRRTTPTSLRLSKFETRNATFRLNSSAEYAANDVSVLFSSFVPVSARNTLLEFSDGVLVFATASFSGNRVTVQFAALDIKLAASTTYTMPRAVFRVESGALPMTIDDPYENIAAVGEAVISCTFLESRVVLLSVSVDGAQSGQFAPLRLNVSGADVVLLPNTLHPDLVRAFDAPFVRAAGAVLSAGALRYCAECTSATSTMMSGFFAFGAPTLSIRKLRACADFDAHIEESAARSMPVRICSVVYKTGSLSQTENVLMDLALTCLAPRPLEVILEVPARLTVFFGDNFEYQKNAHSRVLLSAPCEDSPTLTSVRLFDTTACADGCFQKLMPNALLRIQGGIEISSVRHRPAMSETSKTWDRRTLLQVATPRAAYAPRPVTPDWREHSLITRSLAPLQQLDVRLQRAVSVAWLASVSTKDTEQRVALDALAVVPVLSEHFSPLESNASALVTIVYVPLRAELSRFALDSLASGDDVLDWQRVHAVVHVATPAPELRRCRYLVRLTPVDTNLKLVVISGPSTGCLLDLTAAPHCRVELPERLANDARVVGISLTPISSGCRALSDADDISVEFSPFMRISQCPVGTFLNADTLACESCDTDSAACPSGQFVRGCRPLIHPAAPLQCAPCPAPNHSSFPNASRGCAAWQCLTGFYRKDTACTRCTSLLTNVCLATGGLMRQNCTALENEKCVACAPKPRYSEWLVSSSECSWRCKPGFFENSGACEACQTFSDTAALLAVSGLRVQGAWYRFQACNATAQARAETCAKNDFDVTLDGAYFADGRAFGEDCELRCTENSNLHLARANLSRTGVIWTANRCVACATADWPLFANASRLPRSAFEMNTACEPTCSRPNGFYAHPNRSRTCLFCPSAPLQGACPVGFFFSAQDNCAVCNPCTRTLAGSLFSTSGTFNEARSCLEACPADHFADKAACRPHSVLTCVPGLQFFVAGTASSDARCDTCADCAYAKEVSPCSPTANRVCTSCGPLDAWSSAWSRSGCELVCRAELGYTKLYATGNAEICRKCLPCPPGRALPDRPTNCTCLPCTAPIPVSAVYTAGCAWACPLYHVARAVNGVLLCEYTVRPTSASVKLRPASPLTCPPGQRLTPASTDPRDAATYVCANCTLPAGLRAEDLNKTWTWTGASGNCAWACAWGLEKQQTRGAFACETLRYSHARPPPPAPSSPSGFQISHAVGLAAAAVVCVLFALCFLGRVL